MCVLSRICHNRYSKYTFLGRFIPAMIYCIPMIGDEGSNNNWNNIINKRRVV